LYTETKTFNYPQYPSVGKTRANTVLIHVHSSCFITCSFSLTVSDQKCLLLCGEQA